MKYKLVFKYLCSKQAAGILKFQDFGKNSHFNNDFHMGNSDKLMSFHYFDRFLRSEPHFSMQSDIIRFQQQPKSSNPQLIR